MRAVAFSLVLASAVVAGGAAWVAGRGQAAGGDGATAPASTLSEGYRRFNGTCSHCHGPDGVGSTFAPSLVERPMAPMTFRSIVLAGKINGAAAMRGYAGDPNVAPYIDAIYSYLDARRQGVIGRGRPRVGPEN